MAKVQQDLRSVKRVAAMMAVPCLLAMAGVVYGEILDENFPFNGAERIFRVLCELALASLIYLLGFAVLLTVYGGKLNRLRKEGRHLVVRLLDSHLDTAKAGDKGGAAAKEAGADTGANVFEIYQMTDAGVALQATVAGTKYWKDKDLNK